jgi:hypothetical protein
MGVVISYRNYTEYKHELDSELQKSAESFVRIGFLLKEARDTDILRESGYKSYIDFAQAEYSIDKTTVSRFIRINDRFSENGNSDRLKEQYQEYGYAKLALMLQLPDAVNDIITPEFTKSEIQAIKEEVEEESKISDLEVLMEKEPPITAQEDTILSKAVKVMLHDDPKLFKDLFNAIIYSGGSDASKKRIADILVPSDTKVIMVRVTGIGRLAISLKGIEDDIDIVNLRSGEKESCTWDQLTAEIVWITMQTDDMKSSWQQAYDEPYPEPETPKEPNHPEKPEVAPVQQKKKESKVTKAKVEKKPESISKQELRKQIQQAPELTQKPDQTEASDVIPGQESVLDHPEWLPEGYGTINQKASENESKTELIGTDYQKTYEFSEKNGTNQITRDELLEKGSEAAYAIYISIEGEKSGHMKIDIKAIKERMKQLQVIILDLAAKEDPQ